MYNTEFSTFDQGGAMGLWVHILYIYILKSVYHRKLPVPGVELMAL